MEGQTGVWLLAVLLVAALISAAAQNKTSYIKVGGEIVLEPNPVSGSITSITWKFKEDVVCEWVKDTLPLAFSSKFKGRATLDVTTGVLKINNMTEADSGLYTAEINDKGQDGGHLVEVIKQVPKPEVIKRPLTCSKNSETCVLSCGNKIEGAGPLTFYWKKGDGKWEEGEQNINITNDKDTQAVPTFSCRIKNPLGPMDSEPWTNLFHAVSNTGKIVVIVFGVLFFIIAVVGIGVWLYRRNNNSRDIPVTYTSTPTSPQDNGSAPAEALLNPPNNGSAQP